MKNKASETTDAAVPAFFSATHGVRAKISRENALCDERDAAVALTAKIRKELGDERDAAVALAANLRKELRDERDAAVALTAKPREETAACTATPREGAAAIRAWGWGLITTEGGNKNGSERHGKPLSSESPEWCSREYVSKDCHAYPDYKFHAPAHRRHAAPRER
jgi:hypothetical protein